MTNDLKPGHHCNQVAKSANKSDGFVGNAFEFISEKMIFMLYNSLVRSLQEGSVNFWSPFHKKDHRIDIENCTV